MARLTQSNPQTASQSQWLRQFCLTLWHGPSAMMHPSCALLAERLARTPGFEPAPLTRHHLMYG